MWSAMDIRKFQTQDAVLLVDAGAVRRCGFVSPATLEDNDLTGAGIWADYWQE
jgi:hypothetical protein